jgi:hypothetical protein
MGRLSATMSSTGSDRRGKGAEHGRGRCAPTQRPIVGSAPALERTGAGRGWPVAGRGDRAPPEPGDSHHHSPGRGAAGGGARPVHPVVAAGPARPPGTLWDRVGQDGPAWLGRVLACVHGYDPGRGLGELRVHRPSAGRGVARIDRRHQRLPARGGPQRGGLRRVRGRLRPVRPGHGQEGDPPSLFGGCWSPWAPRPRCSDSLWPRPSHRRCGPLPSLGAWPSAPALPGLGINCGRNRCPDPAIASAGSCRSPSRNSVVRTSCVAVSRRATAAHSEVSH